MYVKCRTIQLGFGDCFVTTLTAGVLHALFMNGNVCPEQGWSIETLSTILALVPLFSCHPIVHQTQVTAKSAETCNKFQNKCRFGAETEIGKGMRGRRGRDRDVTSRTWL